MIIRFDTVLTGLVFYVTSATVNAQDQNVLEVQADVPVVGVETREAGRDFMRLPSLTFELEIDQRCSADLTPTVLSVSVADTRRSFKAETISRADKFATQFAVPAAQIGPVAVAGFCIKTDASIDGAENDSTDLEELRIADVLSLQASLLCASETESQIIYSSASLDVALECDGPEPAMSGVID